MDNSNGTNGRPRDTFATQLRALDDQFRALTAYFKRARRERPRRLFSLLTLGGLLLLPIPLPSFVNTYAKITCAHEWVLVKGPDGQLSANLFNYSTGLSEGYRVSNFDRGSSVRFSLSSSVVAGRCVTKGDTIGSISSSETQERLIGLSGQLAAAQGLLAVTATGEKPAIVQDAQQRLSFAKRKIGEQRKILVRAKKLYTDGVISLGQYEVIENATRALGDEVALASAALDAAQTGAKPEQLTMVQANIAALENEISAIKSRAAGYTITAPLSGRISRKLSPDTLLTISDTTRYVALILVKWSDFGRVAATSNARVTLRGLSRAVHGTVIALDREVGVVHGQRVVIATALLDKPPQDLIPGLTAKCDIACRPISVFALVKQFLLSLTA